MARVPYNPVPQVTPGPSGTPKLGIDAPGEAFGTGVGRAMQDLGRQMERSGDELFTRAIALQTINEDTKALEADTNFMIAAGELHATYRAKLGRDAVDGHPEFMADLKALREKVGSSLTSPHARRAYDRSTMSTLGRTIFSSAGHAATQQKQYVIDQATANVEQTRIDIQSNPGDQVRFDEGVIKIVQDVKAQGKAKGWSPERIQVEAEQQVSAAQLAQIDGISRDEPFKAKEILDNAIERGYLRGPDVTKGTNIVRQQLASTGSKIIADEIGNDPQTAELPLEEKARIARDKAAKIDPKNPLLPLYAEQQVRARDLLTRAYKRDRAFDDKQTVVGAVINGIDGKLPTTVEDLLQDPKAREAWFRMEPTEQKSIMSALDKNARADVPYTPERQALFNRIRGRAQSDVNEFLAINAADLDLPRDKKEWIFGAQAKLKEKASQDPRVQSAMTNLRAAGVLKALGIDKRSENIDGYDQFQGTLQDAIETFQKANNRAPKYDEVLQIGNHIARDAASQAPKPKNFWEAITTPWGFGGKTPFYTQEPSTQDKERIRGLLEDRGQEATDALVQRMYLRELLNKDFNKPQPPRIPQSK